VRGCTIPGVLAELSRSAAGESDVLFVKVRRIGPPGQSFADRPTQVVPGHTNDLATHCDREKIRYLPFLSFKQVEDRVRDVVERRVTVEDIEAGRVKSEEVERALGREQ
jgi:hypothetical protein